MSHIPHRFCYLALFAALSTQPAVAGLNDPHYDYHSIVWINKTHSTIHVDRINYQCFTPDGIGPIKQGAGPEFFDISSVDSNGGKNIDSFYVTSINVNEPGGDNNILSCPGRQKFLTWQIYKDRVTRNCQIRYKFKRGKLWGADAQANEYDTNSLVGCGTNSPSGLRIKMQFYVGDGNYQDYNLGDDKWIGVDTEETPPELIKMFKVMVTIEDSD